MHCERLGGGGGFHPTPLSRPSGGPQRRYPLPPPFFVFRSVVLPFSTPHHTHIHPDTLFFFPIATHFGPDEKLANKLTDFRSFFFLFGPPQLTSHFCCSVAQCFVFVVSVFRLPVHVPPNCLLERRDHDFRPRNGELNIIQKSCLLHFFCDTTIALTTLPSEYFFLFERFLKNWKTVNTDTHSESEHNRRGHGGGLLSAPRGVLGH